MCGENLTDVGAWTRVEGSPPRVRGKREPDVSEFENGGLTPACAGKTGEVIAEVRADAAHPRVCGENVANEIRGNERRGSPPRVRGKPAPPETDRGATRLTPACAGKTAPRVAEESMPAAHPRVCGENNVEQDWIAFTRGSPPRVRGKHAGGELGLAAGRLTPACAGKT